MSNRFLLVALPSVLTCFLLPQSAEAHRQYSPQHRRFLQRDPMHSRFFQRDPRIVVVARGRYRGAASSLYCYLEARPLGYLDPLGESTYPCGTPLPAPPIENPGCTSCAIPLPPPTFTTASCDGLGNCQANLGPQAESLPGWMKTCVIAHECAHCREAPFGCCLVAANGAPDNTTDPAAGECAAAAGTLACLDFMEPADCFPGSNCWNQSECLACGQMCYISYLCPNGGGVGGFAGLQQCYAGCTTCAQAQPPINPGTF
jgi:hypothetical protein